MTEEQIAKAMEYCVLACQAAEGGDMEAATNNLDHVENLLRHYSGLPSPLDCPMPRQGGA
jgi:hypothetical protein